MINYLVKAFVAMMREMGDILNVDFFVKFFSSNFYIANACSLKKNTLEKYFHLQLHFQPNNTRALWRNFYVPRYVLFRAKIPRALLKLLFLNVFYP